MKSQKFLSIFLALCLLFSSCVMPVYATGTTTTESTEEIAEESIEEEEEAEEETDLPGGLNTTSSILTNPDATNTINVSITGSAALLVDANTRTVLYAENAQEKVYPASTTKIMTALLVLEAIERGELTMDTVITTTEEANADIGSDSSTQNISTGEQMSVENLLYCLLVSSANEAANILAIAVSGSVSDFVELMNQRAEELGCTGTHFVNPHGLHDSSHYTTCIDLYLITEAAWAYEDFQTIVGTDEYYVPATNLSDQRHLYNTNLLLSEKKTSGYVYTYAVGIKTGTTLAAGACLVAAAIYNGRLLISVEMGTTNYTDSNGNVIRPVYTETAQLFRHGFLDFYSLTVAEEDELITQITVELGSDADYVLISPAEDVTIDLVKGLKVSDFDRVYHLPDSINAPVSAGDVVGTMDLVYDGEVYATVDLVAVTDVELSVSAQAEAVVVGFFQSPLVRVLLAILFVLVVALVALLVSSLLRRNRERNKERNRQRRRAQREARRNREAKREAKRSTGRATGRRPEGKRKK